MQWERKMDCVDETGRSAKYLGNIMGQEVWAWAASGAGGVGLGCLRGWAASVAWTF